MYTFSIVVNGHLSCISFGHENVLDVVGFPRQFSNLSDTRFLVNLGFPFSLTCQDSAELYQIFFVNYENLGFRICRENCVNYDKIEIEARLRKSHIQPKCILFLPFDRCYMILPCFDIVFTLFASFTACEDDIF